MQSLIFDLALDAASADLAVHKVEAAQEGRLAATGRADESGDLAFVEIERGAVQRMMVAVVDVDVARRKDNLAGSGAATAAATARFAGGDAIEELVGLVCHSAVILLARALPTMRARMLNSKTQIISSAAVPQTISWACGLPSP